MTDQMDIQDDLVPVAPSAPSRRKFFAIGVVDSVGGVAAIVFFFFFFFFFFSEI